MRKITAQSSVAGDEYREFQYESDCEIYTGTLHAGFAVIGDQMPLERSRRPSSTSRDDAYESERN
jgi:hypothetical protein